VSRILLSGPDVGDLELSAVIAAFESGWVAPVGPALSEFEAAVSARINWPGAVALSSGTAALHLGLLEVGVKPGDVVICSTFTFVASANAIGYCGASPMFVDSERQSWNMSPELLRDAISHCQRHGLRVGAVLTVDLYGQCADMDPITDICRAADIPVVEDAAEALGATYRGRPAGTLGDLGVFSFNGNKIITTSGGGMLVSPDLVRTERVRYLATQARQPTAHYEHTEAGFNYRLSNLLAALGVAQLSRLDHMIARRRVIRERYRSSFADHLEFMPEPEWSTSNAWLSCVLAKSTAERDAIIATLAANDIESRPLWKPMHLQPLYAQSLAVVDGTSEDLFSRGLCLPSSSALRDDEVDFVLSVIMEALVSSAAGTTV
jgi:dTDP-4-amino-4,6-dideoxygalactose transaminase